MAPSVTNYSEIQHDEIEALRSIFMDDFEEEEAKVGAWNKSTLRAFAISLKAVIAGEDKSALTLSASLPLTYPKSLPILNLRFHEDLRPKIRFGAQQLIDTKPKSLLGSEMIFEIVTSLQEILDGFEDEQVLTLDEERAARESAAAQARAAQLEEDNRLKAAKAIIDEAKDHERQLLFLAQLQNDRNDVRQPSVTDASLVDVPKESPGIVVFEQPSVTRIRDLSGKPLNVRAVHNKVLFFQHQQSTLFTVQPWQTSEHVSFPSEYQKNSLILRECHISKGDCRGNEQSLRTRIQKLEIKLESLLRLRPHPNVTGVINYRLHRSTSNQDEIASDRWTLSILTELASKGSLKDLLEIIGVLSITNLRAWAIQILEGLQHYHRHGISHANVHLGNILLEKGEADNTIVKLSDGGYQHDIHFMKEAQDAKTPLAWAAPEVLAHPQRDPSPASDIWYFGVCLLRMAFGVNVVIEHPSPNALLEELPLSKSVIALLTRVFNTNEKDRPSAWDMLHFEFFRNDDNILSQVAAPAIAERLTNGSASLQFGKAGYNPAAPNFSRYHSEFVEEGRLGRGGFGEVYRARNKVDAQLYAIKKVKAQSKAALDPVLSEATVLSRLNHPNVVRYFASWIDDKILSDDEVTDASENDCFTSSADNIMHESTMPSSSRGLDFISSNNSHVVFGAAVDNSISDDDDFEESSDQAGEESEEESSHKNGVREGQDSDTHEDSVYVMGKPNGNSVDSRPVTHNVWTILYIQMEYCKQETLRDLITNNIQLDINESWRLFRQILQGLAHIHSLSIVHRDLKPENVFIDSGGDVRIGDFGLARPGDYRSSAKARELQEGYGSFTKDIGTASYVAPEVRSVGNGKYNEKADMYSLGIILLELNVIFSTAMERAETLESLRKESHVPPKALDVPDKALQATLLMSLIDHKPSRRPSSSELLENGRIPLPDHNETLHLARRELNDPKSRLRSEFIDRLFSMPQTFQHPSSNAVPGDLAQRLDTLEGISEMSRSPPNLHLQAMVRQRLTDIFNKHGAIERADSPALYPLNPCYASTDVVQFLDSKGKLFQLPYDLILPNAMLLAKSSRPEPKTFIFGDVYRRNALQGRISIFGEADFDIASSSATSDFMITEAEVMKTLDEVLDGFPNLLAVQMCYHVNHSQLLDAILSFCKIGQENWTNVKETISKLNTSDWIWAKVRHELRAPPLSIASTCLDELERFDFRDTLEKALNRVKQILLDTTHLEAAFGHLRELTKYLARFQIKRKIYLNPLSSYNEEFYRGNIFFQCLYDHKKRGVFAAGGRYDSLVRNYRPISSRGNDAHAVGFQFAWSGLCTDLMAYLKAQTNSKRKKRKQLDSSAWTSRRSDVLINSFDPGLLRTVGIDILTDLWANGISAELAAQQRGENITNAYTKTTPSKDDHGWLVLVKSEDLIKIKSSNRQDEEEVRTSELINYLRTEIRDRNRLEARVAKTQMHRQISHQESNANTNEREVDVIVLMSQNKGKKVNRKTIVEEAMTQAQEWRSASLDTPIIAIETKDEVFDAVGDTRFEDADSWKKLMQEAPPAERQYLSQVHSLLKEQRGARAAFIYNFRTRGMIYYRLGK